jgi:hypothetical protein
LHRGDAGRFVDFPRPKRYIRAMSARPSSKTALYIRQMVERHYVAYHSTKGDVLAGHFARLADMTRSISMKSSRCLLPSSGQALLTALNSSAFRPAT